MTTLSHTATTNANQSFETSTIVQATRILLQVYKRNFTEKFGKLKFALGLSMF